MSKKYHIITYGCQMNKADSERISAVLEREGYKPAQKENEADLIVVNMCSVRQSAVDRVYGLIPKFEKLIKNQSTKQKVLCSAEPINMGSGKKLKTVLTGCVLKTDKNKLRKGFDEIWEDKNYPDVPPKCQSDSMTYIPVSNGCNNFCSYCVVPFTRGILKCRDHKKILKEAKKAVKNGFEEVWLLGQNVNDYQSPTDPSVTKPQRGEGRDEGKLQRRQTSSINFAELLKMVNDIPGDFRIFFMSPHPKNFSDELIETLAKCEKFGNLLNLPVQSGDDKILRKMNRNYTVKEYKNLVKKIRRKMPEIKLSTDVIVGFPGETKKQFQNTVKLFKEMKFVNAYISKYSPRPGTAAFNLKDNIPLTEKKKREKVLRKIIS